MRNRDESWNNLGDSVYRSCSYLYGIELLPNLFWMRHLTMTTHYVLIEFDTDKPIADLTDKIAGRIYTMDGVNNKMDVAATDITVQIEGMIKERCSLSTIDRFLATAERVKRGLFE